MTEAPADLRVVMRHVLKAQSFKLIWRKTSVVLAVVPQQIGASRVFMCPVLSVTQLEARGDNTRIPLDNRKGRGVLRTRLLAPSRQDVETHTFVLRYGGGSTILRLRAPNREIYTLWTSAIVSALRSGHAHPAGATELCLQCLVCSDDGVDGLLARADPDPQLTRFVPAKATDEALAFNNTSITLPSSLDSTPSTPTLPTVDGSVGGPSIYSSTLVLKPSCTTPSILCFQVHIALMREDIVETWTMEARKNMLLRIYAQTPRESTWSVEAVLAVLRLRAARTFQLAFNLFGDLDTDLSARAADAFASMAMVLQRNVYVVSDLASECEHLEETTERHNCRCRCCVSKFRVFSPINNEKEWRMSAVDWLRKLSAEVLKALRSPVVLHVTGRLACSLLRFSELQSCAREHISSGTRCTVDLSNIAGTESAT